MSTTTQSRLFGTDGIRATAGSFPLDPATVVAIGQAVGELLGGEIIVGRDPRESGPWLQERLGEGIVRSPARIRSAGVLPTPAVALLTRRSEASGGVMISASHNPFEDNGIKVFGAAGEKLGDDDEVRIEERVSEILAGGASPRANAQTRNGGSENRAEASAYLDLLREGFPNGRWLEGLRIALDCANGAMSQVAPLLFESLGATVRTLHSNPDGRNINAGCGAVHPGHLVEWVRENSVDLGVAYDGDGDRSLFVSGSGRLIDGDGVLLVMARAMKAAGRLDPPAVVGTSMTNIALEQIFASEGIRLDRADVGDRYVFRKMRDQGVPLGGEPSGHIIFADQGLSGDGLLTTLRLCEVLAAAGQGLDELTADWNPAPQLLRSLRVQRKTPLEDLPIVATKIQYIKHLLGSDGRIVVRYSGTEPVLRIMIESDSGAKNESLADELTHVIREALGTWLQPGPRP